MNLQAFKKKWPCNKYVETKKLFFDQYPVKLKFGLTGCRLLNRKKHVPRWITEEGCGGHETAYVTVRKDREIRVNATVFRSIYRFLGTTPPPNIRFDDPIYYINTVGHFHTYFPDLESAHKWIAKFPHPELLVEVSVPYNELKPGDLVVPDSITAEGFKYRINLNPFTIDLSNKARYATIFKNFSDEIRVAPSLADVLWKGEKMWGPKRNQWWLRNKYFYVRDLSVVTFVTLAFPNLVQSVSNLVTKEETPWQSLTNK
jgi:hypothetical protein